MYRPTHFQEDRADVLLAALRDIRFGAIVSTGVEGLQVTHVPCVAKEIATGIVLETHIARANPHWQSAPTLDTCEAQAPETVVIFQGPQEYISPSFYPSKAEHGKVVPTWTYIAIHAHGHLRHTEDPAWLLRHLNEMTDEKEAPRDAPWQVADAPDRYIEARMRGIVGLPITVDRLEGSWKLNQNKSEADQAGTVAGLEAESAMGKKLAEAWRERQG